jgi:cystathionine beta-lyase/cystathionine gamma-synthase
MRPATLAVHAGRDDFEQLGVHTPPLDLSSTYPIPDLDEGTASLDALASGDADAPNAVYSRLRNPTVARFEGALAQLEGTETSVAFASGMAAMTACLLAARQRGGHVVAVRPLYGGTDHLLATGLLGLEVTWATADTVGASCRADTSLVIIETPANPTCELMDIADVVRQAGDVPVLVDSTFATPVLQRPVEHGAALVLHSATKFLGGHGDVLAGVVATSEAHAHPLRQVRILTGGILHPLAGYLLHRGLATLPVRVERAQATTRLIAERLAAHPAVARTYYPGLPGGDPLGIIGRQMDGPGAVLAFDVAGGYDAAVRLLDALSLITVAVSLGSVDTLIQHPAGLTHRVVDADARTTSGIGPGMLRLSVGLEDVEDLWEDLERGLRQAASVGSDSAADEEDAIGAAVAVS